MNEQWHKLIMWDESRHDKFLFAESGNLCGLDVFDLKDGKPVQEWDVGRAYLKSHSAEYDGEPDDLLANVYQLPVFSARLRGALQAAGANPADIQHLPVRVFQSTGEEIKGYTIGNVISRFAALDYDATKMLELHDWEIDPLTGTRKVTSLWHAALRSEKLKGHDVIRLLEFFPSIFVSDRFKRVFEANKCTGTTFKKEIMT